ncbi:MAG: glycosyltransferase family 4 protein [Candidatus Aminicenantes bacterium]|nr:MAG: glycosyltransferase family 4 protein [Candidatus Aminicenantes bacterium]
MKKSILIVYPHSIFEEKEGINTRYIQLLKYFIARDFRVDVLTLQNFKSSWEHYPVDKGGLINELFFYDFKKGSRGQKQKNKMKNQWARVRKRIPFFYAYTHLPDFAYESMRKHFNQIVTNNHYDFILISYVYWANLLNRAPVKKSVKLLDLSDFLTLNRFDSSEGDVKIGAMLEEEIRRVNLFDKVMCISEDERFFFSQFARQPQYYYVPFFMKKNNISRDANPRHDLVFVGSDNPHNRKGMKWFFDHVYPLLDKSMKILIVGSVAKYIKARAHVVFCPYLEKLDDIYTGSRISICPLLGGTGLKVKVVEALSFGLPVITTYKGVAGFPSKINNGCLIAGSPKEFANCIHKLLKDKDLYDFHSQQALDFFLENFEESKVYHQLDEIFLSE